MNWDRTTKPENFSPLSIGVIHFVGIGGIGMSGIAEILHNLGYKVQGSDLSDNANVKRLRDKGILIHIGHRAENLGEAGVVIISSAVKRDNPEMIAAREAMLPIVRRAEMLGELMRLKWSVAVGGTHGKTTTTSIVACLFDAAGLDPTVINLPNYPPPSLSLRILIPNIWITITILTMFAAPTIRSYRTFPSMALPSCALIIPKCRR
jgi:hypothetical protein